MGRSQRSRRKSPPPPARPRKASKTRVISCTSTPPRSASLAAATPPRCCACSLRRRIPRQDREAGRERTVKLENAPKRTQRRKGAETQEFRLLALSPRSEEHTSELQSPCNLVCR